MSDVIPLWLAETVLVLAPLILALSIGAHLRLRRHIRAASEPVVAFWNFRWNSGLIVLGGLFLFREAAVSQTLGSLVQVCGLVLAVEFFYVAYANLRVLMSTRGLLLGMSFSSWRRFSGSTWHSEETVELHARSRKRYQLRVPKHRKALVVEILNQNILQ